MYPLFRLLYFLASFRLLSKVWRIFYYLDFFRKPIVMKNLRIAFPTLEKRERIKLAKEIYKNFAKFLEDLLLYQKGDPNLSIELKNREIFEKALETGKPIILVTAHFGNWELTPKIISSHYRHPLAIVMRRIENEKINKFFEKIRQQNREDIKLIDKKGSSKEILKALIKEKRILGILIDQRSNASTALKVNFFIPNTSFNPAVSKLAKATGAVVIPLFTYWNGEKYVLEFFPSRIFDKKEDSIQEFTQWQATLIENMIRRYPAQYYWFHDRWRNTL
ncbi:MAG: lysophospholipid acyltransferase family protein [Epsilonproteobacteria bacterium]|nr:lysophospholipid acyltransferase family protein [Campylobacterota bacterium]